MLWKEPKPNVNHAFGFLDGLMYHAWEMEA